MGMSKKMLQQGLFETAIKERFGIAKFSCLFYDVPSSYLALIFASAFILLVSPWLSQNNQPPSILAEEVSEESITVKGTTCACEHKEGCSMRKGKGGDKKAIDTHKSTGGERAVSAEVRNRLEELQGRVAALEQEKARSAMMDANRGERGEGIEDRRMKSRR